MAAKRQVDHEGDMKEETTGASADQHRWDEDDVVMFFWGNSKAAQERHARAEEEHTDCVKKWRSAVTGSILVV